MVKQMFAVVQNIKGMRAVVIEKDIDYIDNLKLIRELFKNKTEAEITQILISIADKEIKDIKNKSS